MLVGLKSKERLSKKKQDQHCVFERWVRYEMLAWSEFSKKESLQCKWKLTLRRMSW